MYIRHRLEGANNGVGFGNYKSVSNENRFVFVLFDVMIRLDSAFMNIRILLPTRKAF